MWIVDTPSNKPVAQRLWKDRPNESHLTGITTFNDVEFSSPEELLIGELASIDLHHGAYSADPPYTVIDVHERGASGPNFTQKLGPACGTTGVHAIK